MNGFLSFPGNLQTSHIRIYNPVHNCNMRKMYIPENLQQPSGSRWVFQQVQPYGRLRQPTKLHLSYHSNLQPIRC